MLGGWEEGTHFHVAPGFPLGPGRNIIPQKRKKKKKSYFFSLISKLLFCYVQNSNIQYTILIGFHLDKSQGFTHHIWISLSPLTTYTYQN